MITNEQMIAQIEVAERFIDKKYMESLKDYRVLGLKDFEKKYNLIRLFHITKIVYDKNENNIEKLISVFNSIMPFCMNLVLLIRGEKNSADIYLGVRASSQGNANIAGDVLHDAFLGNFPGSKLEKISSESISEIFKMSTNDEFSGFKNSDIAYMNILPSLRENKEEDFSQGLEKFIDTMKGHDYLCEILASPLSNTDIQNRLNGFEELYSSLFPFSKKTSSHGHNEGQSLTDGINESISRSISNGISRAISRSDGYSHGTNQGTNVGMHMLLGFGMSYGTSEGWNVGNGESDSFTNTDISSEQFGKQRSKTTTSGTTDNLTIEFRNKGIENLLDKLERHIKRLKTGESYGMWETSSYFIAQDKKTAAIAASTYRSLLLGEETGIENAHFTLFGGEETQTETIEEALRYCTAPRFLAPAFDIDIHSHGKQLITPSNYVNGKEIPLLLNLPRKSVNGIMVTKMAEFGRNVLLSNKGSDRNIKLGNIYHMGNTEKSVVNLNIDSLTSHTFVTGSTGSGKSNTVYKLIDCVSEYDIPFLVIEPAKGEYRNQFRNKANINLFTTNPRIDQMLKLNPFSFDSNIHILEHLDRLIEIFNACWEMYAAMPAILKEAMEEAYINKGWDLLNSVYIGKGEPTFPTFIDVLQELPKIINSSQYSADTKGDYTGALVTRVNSMTNGIYGQIFCDDFEVEDKNLFDQCTIVDLSRIGSSETKSLIMGILILKLSEYRMAHARKGNSELRHMTILEEAHNILKNTTNISSTAGNSIMAKSVEMIVNSIAEMRTYGEGFVIVDQSPTSVDIAAIKNTNTKIVMRLPEKDDCSLAGYSVSLNQEQIDELAKLDIGVAVEMQNNWEEPVLSKIDKASEMYEDYAPKVSFEKLRAFNSMVLSELLKQYEETDQHDVSALVKKIEDFDIIPAKKTEMIRMVRQFARVMNRKYNSILFGRTLLRLAGCGDAFKKAEKNLKYEKDDDGKPVSEFTKNSFSKWYYETEEALSEYVSVSSHQQETLRQYILHAKKFENRPVNYSVLYNQLYRK